MTDGADGGGRTPLDDEVYHRQEELDAFNERAELIGDYAELVDAAKDETARELAAVHGPGAGARRALLWGQHRWLDALLFLLLVTLVALVATFFMRGDDLTESLDSASPAAETEASAQGAEGQATDDADAADDAATTDDAAEGGGSAGSDAAAGQPGEGTQASEAPPLDLAARVVSETEATNAAFASGDNGVASEHLMAIKSLMTAYIQAGGDTTMPKFSEAHDKWLWAANDYVGGNEGAIGEMQAAYGELVEALSEYQAAAGSPQ